jgi:DNA-binding transcriptional LysR family regulator
MQIRQLEESAGLPLFNRVGKSLQLTQAVEEMCRYSSRCSRP